MVSLARPPLSREAAIQRLAGVVFEGQSEILMSPNDQATWVTALIQLAAYVANVPAGRRRQAIKAAAKVLVPDIVFREG